MKCKVVYEIHPSGAFGVPDGTKTVLPRGITPIEGVSDEYHTGTQIRTGYGTLPHYRDEESTINVKLNMGEITGILKDNFLFLDVEASSAREAYKIAVETVDRFIQHLTLNTRLLFSYKPLFIEGENGELLRFPEAFTLTSVMIYDLTYLRNAIADAEKMSQLSDPVLDKALQYYEHALFLFENANKETYILSRHFRHMIAAAFLNLWKAVSTIAGDPSVDSDYQSRYKRLGFDYNFFKSQIEFVRNLRNNYDVAHYHIEPDRLKEIEQNYGKSKEVAECILLAYRQYLLRGSPSFATSGQT